MTDQNQLDALIARIQEQRATADRDTIRQQLLAAGAPQPLVDQALAQVYGAEPVTTPTTSSPPAFESVSVDRIRAYLEQHKEIYTREALRDRLIQDGHNPQAIDLAIAQAYGFAVSSTPAPPETNRTQFILTIAGVFLFNYIVWVILFALTINSSAAGLWAVPVMLVLEGIVATVLRRSNRTLSRGLSWGIGLTVLPLVTLALLFGICLAILGGLY